ncbi:MAG: glucosaminidase domain-containing protein [Firmicutes bacterium]|nr:glucosaminidase domain-containing protein [Bacillota bacterium]
MKLEDKTIAQITAIFDAEIAELEKEIKAAAEDALSVAESRAAVPADESGEPVTETADEVANPETVAAPDHQVVDEVQPDEEIEQVVDEIAEIIAPVVDENPEASDEPAVVVEAPETSDEPAVVDEEPEIEDVPADTGAETAEQPAEDSEPVVDEEPEADEESEAAEEPVIDEEVSADIDANDTVPVTFEEPPVVPAEPVKYSTAKNILGAAGYLLAVAAICVLSVVAVNLLDTQIQSTKPIAPPDVPQSNLAASLQTYTANEVIAQQAVPQPTLQQIYAMDLRTPSGATEADLKRVSKAGLVGLEDTFLQAEKQYGVNAIFLMSIASLESAHGTMMYRPNNMFGYGGKSYPSKEACIMDVASGLSSKYLRPGASLYGGSPTLAGVNKRYAANPQWYAKVGKYMKSYYDVIAPYHNQNLNKIK